MGNNGESDINLVKMQSIEKVVYRNVKGIGDRCKLLEFNVEKLKESNKTLLAHIHSLEGTIEQMKKQLSVLQQQFYAKGTVSYGDNSELANKRGIDTPD